MGRVLWIRPAALLAPETHQSPGSNQGKQEKPTLIARIIQVHKEWLPVRRQRVHVNGVSVVLTGDVAATGRQVQRRDVVSSVAVLQLDGTGTRGQRQQLMTQANTENRDLRSFHQLSKMVHGVLAVRRVTRSVRDENSVKVVGHLVDGIVKGEHGDAGSAVDHAAKNVLLDTAVQNGNVVLWIRRADVERRLGADLTDKMELLRVDVSLVLVRIVLLANSQAGKGGTPFTQVRNNLTGIHSGDSRDTLTVAPFTQALDCRPVAVLLGDIRNNNTSGLQIGRLEVTEKTVLIALRRGHTVITDQRLGEDQNLAPVGRIRQRFRVSNQRSGEDSLSRDIHFGTERLPVKDRAIPNGEGSPFTRLTVTETSHGSSLKGDTAERRGRSPDGRGLEHSSKHHDD